MKLGYFADGPWAHNAFHKIQADPGFTIAFVCVRNDFRDPVLVELAGRHGIPVLCHPRVNSDEFHAELRKYPCDLFVSMSFNQIFRPKTFSLPPLQTINCHAGKLPFYRGRNILNWALINDEREFGITVHHVDEGIDTGDIVLQRSYPITDDDTYETLLKRAHHDCAAILYDALVRIRAGDAPRIQQQSIHPVGMYCGPRRPGDERLDWNQPSRRVFNFVRALCRPGPQATCRRQDAPVRINRVALVPDAPTYIGIPGQVLGRIQGKLIVKTADSFVEVVEHESETPIRTGDRLE